MSAVEVKDIVKRYGTVAALDRVTVTVAEGEFFALLGPSGSGKTTLLRAIAGFVIPDSGEIRIDGQRIERVPVYRRGIGMKMLYRHHGYVPTTWVYGYAHAVLGPRARHKPWVEAAFVASLISISFFEFCRYNRRVPRTEWARWGTWVRHGWRKLRERAT